MVKGGLPEPVQQIVLTHKKKKHCPCFYVGFTLRLFEGMLRSHRGHNLVDD